ncbi:hypothetical protein [Sphingobacterium multivorum]|uniref:hypothetical protein n=1 Tax=Sphingobacterium multivorum TaxID=28454 RepID=UPI0036787BD6
MKTFKPILFSTPMVCALVENRKNQTRRLIRGIQSDDDAFKTIMTKRRLWDSTKEIAPGPVETNAVFINKNGEEYKIKSKYQVGDILWVRESFAELKNGHNEVFNEYKANGVSNNSDYGTWSWKPSIHMPKEAARIFLEVTLVRVERLRDLFHIDARDEGVKFIEANNSRLYYNYLTLDYGCNELFSFMTLWQSIHGIESWEENPWVWVYGFKKIDKPSNFC